jgi:hypothetical protein
MFKFLRGMQEKSKREVKYALIYIFCVAFTLGLSVGLYFHPNRQIYLKSVLENENIKREAIGKGYAVYRGKFGDTSNWMWKDRTTRPPVKTSFNKK